MNNRKDDDESSEREVYFHFYGIQLNLPTLLQETIPPTAYPSPAYPPPPPGGYPHYFGHYPPEYPPAYPPPP
ncbi:hypothetical protein PHAVU_010G037500 [Phaseolus vulgaris]|uniref:Uncharacterized protein n=1 Tax=Phaseolus vulgaris TaxID=3885 RepID=V7AM34_PHAVU|nr:hypothetical protein PHAVU_010G037500g [Phaseolus vulgaris]ESW06315.1 hypothetical protein PHAVU_010G037500g [Phaseolus vulgaris]